jgi:hypothetical protein
VTTATPLEPVIPLQREPRYDEFPLTWGDITRRALATLLPMAVLGAAIHLTFDVLNLGGWFPACLLLAVVLEFAIVPTRSWWALWFAATPPLGVITSLSLIIGFQWGYAEAQLAISSLWWFIVFCVLLLGIPANKAIWTYRRRADTTGQSRWQFPLRYLVALMVILSFALAFIKVALPKEGDYRHVGYINTVILLVLGIAFSLFLANLKENKPLLSANPWDDPETPAPLDVPPTT